MVDMGVFILTTFRSGAWRHRVEVHHRGRTLRRTHMELVLLKQPRQKYINSRPAYLCRSYSTITRSKIHGLRYQQTPSHRDASKVTDTTPRLANKVTTKNDLILSYLELVMPCPGHVGSNCYLRRLYTLFLGMLLLLLADPKVKVLLLLLLLLLRQCQLLLNGLVIACKKERSCVILEACRGYESS